MNKKPGLFVAIALLALIILAASYGLNLGGNDTGIMNNGIDPSKAIYVCPVDDTFWDTLARGFRSVRKFISMGFIFVVIILFFSWAWALYQNLLKDKFSEDAYKNPWGLTKVFFWIGIMFTLFIMTPNHFRRVYVGTTEYVLCEKGDNGAHPVPPLSVKAE